MLSPRRAWDVFVDLPLGMHIGLIVVCLGTLFDVGAHIAAGDLSPTFTRLTPAERLGHWVVLGGMLISLASVVFGDYRRPRDLHGGQ